MSTSADADCETGDLCLIQEEQIRMKSEDVKARESRTAEAQKELRKLIKHTDITDKAAIQIFEENFQEAQKKANLDGEWPSDLEPAADLIGIRAEIAAGRRLPCESLKRRIRRAFEDVPVADALEEDIVTKAEALYAVVTEIEDDLLCDDPREKYAEDFPLDSVACKVLYEGYLMLLCPAAEVSLGADAGHVLRCKRKLQDLKSGVDHAMDASEYSVRGDELRRDFAVHQEALLRWCAIPETARFALPDDLGR